MSASCRFCALLLLLFISLGITLPQLTLDILIGALILVAIVLVAKLLIFSPALLASGEGFIVAIVVAINLTQIGEFALKFLPLGYYQGLLTRYEFGVISYATLISIAISTYLIRYEYKIAFFLDRIFGQYFMKTMKNDVGNNQKRYKIIFLGYHQNATSLFEYATKDGKFKLPETLVVDYRYAIQKQIRNFGSDVFYGDISNPHTLEAAGVAHANVVICCIDDFLLKGTSNLRLLEACKHLNKDIKFIGTANDTKTESELIKNGVFAVHNPSDEAAPGIFGKIVKAF